MDRILDQFQYEHLPPHLQAISKPFSDLAHSVFDMIGVTGYPQQKLVAMQKLLESKDAAVRAFLGKDK
jgi:hypothetical protein